MRPRGMKQAVVEEEPPPVDPTGWMLDSVFCQFLLLHTKEIKYMCMFGYTFFHGTKIFAADADKCTSYKFVSMVLACTGGGILVPIFINSIPVPLATDAYPIAITASFLLHAYVPILRQVMKESTLLKAAIIVLYELFRANVVVTLTKAATAAISPSDFDFPVFGPIFCGAIAGCGGAFFPLNKGLEPLVKGLAPNMMTALVAAAFYHLFLSTSISDGVVDADKKAHLIVAQFFVAYGLSQGIEFGWFTSSSSTSSKAAAAKKES